MASKYGGTWALDVTETVERVDTGQWRIWRFSDGTWFGLAATTTATVTTSGSPIAGGAVSGDITAPSGYTLAQFMAAGFVVGGAFTWLGYHAIGDQYILSNGTGSGTVHIRGVGWGTWTVPSGYRYKFKRTA
jgi:hypothetical protein